MRHDGTDTTGQDTTEQTRHDATAAPRVVSVPDAAAVLGISPGAVRKRLERGQLAGRKVAGQWQVLLTAIDATDHVIITPADTTDATRRDTTDRTRHDATGQDATAMPPAVSPAARAQLEAIRDEWLAPLVTQIREQAERIGRLEAERDALAAQVAAAQARDDAGQRAADQLVDLLQEQRDALHAEVERLRATQRAPRTAGGVLGATDETVPGRGTAPIGPPAWRRPPSSGASVGTVLRRLWGRLAGRG